VVEAKASGCIAETAKWPKHPKHVGVGRGGRKVGRRRKEEEGEEKEASS